MKKIAMMTLALMASCVCAFSSETSENLRVINVCNITFEDDFHGFVMGQHPDMVIEFSAQTILPLNFFRRGDWLSLIENNRAACRVQVQQTFYARAVIGDDEEVEFKLSADLIQWREFLDFVVWHLTFNRNVEAR